MDDGNEVRLAGRPDLLLLIAGDLGVESSLCYTSDGAQPLAATPNLDVFCQTGMVFDNAWSSPTSPRPAADARAGCRAPSRIADDE